MRMTSLSMGACLLLTPFVAAQGRGVGSLYTANLPGDLFLPPGSVNISAMINAGTGQDPDFPYTNQNGVTRLPNGHYIISSRRARIFTPHKFFELASDGSYIAQYDQPNHINADSLGLGEHGWDRETGPDSRIWAVTGRTAVTSFDWHTNTFDPFISFGPVGTKILANYAGDSITCCAVADIDGRKVLVTADPSTPYLQFPFTPYPGLPTNWHVIQTPAVGVLPGEEFISFGRFRMHTADPSEPGSSPPISGVPRNRGKYGLAFDPVHNTLWYALDAAVSNPNSNQSAIRFQEMDLDGKSTGRIFQGHRAVVGLDLSGGLTWGEASGVQFYVDDSGDLVIVYVARFRDNSPPIDDVLVEMHAGFDFGAGCNGGDIGWENEPFVGNLDTFNITLENAPANALDAAFLFRSVPVAAPGVQFPGLINCGLLLSLGGLRMMGGGTIPLVNGEASFHQVLPDIQSIVGIEIGYQWLLPGGINVLPLDLSAAGVVRIGENM